MKRNGLKRGDLCSCGSGKRFKKCCYPRTVLDFTKPNFGIPTPFEEQEATRRALARLEGLPPQNKGILIEKPDVGRSRVLCAPLAPYGGALALPGTEAPPSPMQIEAKYLAIRQGNPKGVTEVLLTYTCPERFGVSVHGDSGSSW